MSLRGPTYPTHARPPMPPAPTADEWLEAACARIKAADDAAADGDYMLDSDDCISVLRGTWKGPLANDCPKPASSSAPACRFKPCQSSFDDACMTACRSSAPAVGGERPVALDVSDPVFNAGRWMLRAEFGSHEEAKSAEEWLCGIVGRAG